MVMDSDNSSIENNNNSNNNNSNNLSFFIITIINLTTVDSHYCDPWILWTSFYSEHNSDPLRNSH